MQLHTLQPSASRQRRKRIGRGGKRGTYSGHGMKGQKARAGARIRPGFRGGDNPIWKLFPKQRGASKKTEVKHRTFRLKKDKPTVLNTGLINKHFVDGETVSIKTLYKKGLIRNKRDDVKILGQGSLTKKLIFSGVKVSASVQQQLTNTGGSIA